MQTVHDQKELSSATSESEVDVDPSERPTLNRILQRGSDSGNYWSKSWQEEWGMSPKRVSSDEGDPQAEVVSCHRPTLCWSTATWNGTNPVLERIMYASSSSIPVPVVLPGGSAAPSGAATQGWHAVQEGFRSWAGKDLPGVLLGTASLHAPRKTFLALPAQCTVAIAQHGGRPMAGEVSRVFVVERRPLAVVGTTESDSWAKLDGSHVKKLFLAKNPNCAIDTRCFGDRDFF